MGANVVPARSIVLVCVVSVIGMAISGCGPGPRVVATPTLIPTAAATATSQPTAAASAVPASATPALDGRVIRQIGGPVAISPDKALVAAAGSHGVSVYRTDTFEVAWIGLNQGGASSLAFSPDGAMIASGGGNDITIWDARSGKMLRKLTQPGDSVTEVVFLPDGSLISAWGSSTVITVWDVQSGIALRSLTVEGLDVVFSQDGTQIVSEGDDSLEVWNSTTGDKIAQLTLPGDRPLGDITPGSLVWGKAFSPDDAQLAAGLPDSEKVYVWDIQTGSVAGSYDMAFPISLAFSGNGKRLVASGYNLGPGDGIVKVWDVESAQTVDEGLQSPNQILWSAVSTDGSVMAYVSGRTVTLWDMQNHTTLHTWRYGG